MTKLDQMLVDYRLKMGKSSFIDRTSSWPIGDFSKFLLDEPLPVDSHLTEVIQLADVVAYSVWRGINYGLSDNWFQRIKPALARRWGTDDIDDAGLTKIS
jgi:hypothetical protein